MLEHAAQRYIQANVVPPGRASLGFTVPQTDALLELAAGYTKSGARHDRPRVSH